MMPASTESTALVEREMAQVPLGELVEACQRESLRYRREGVADERFAMEVVRRAVGDRDSLAWEAFVMQHRACVMATIRRHPAWLANVEEDAYWLNRTFQRFWMAVGPHRLHQFTTLASVIGYLKMCAHSVVVDEIRLRRPEPVKPIEQVPEYDLGSGDAVAEAIDELAAVELWRSIEGELHGESERLIARLSWVGQMAPDEIYARHRTTFRDVADVYRMKRNLVYRLRRSPRVNAHLRPAT